MTSIEYNADQFNMVARRRMAQPIEHREVDGIGQIELLEFFENPVLFLLRDFLAAKGRSWKKPFWSKKPPAARIR
jgi:hypothetical protein